MSEGNDDVLLLEACHIVKMFGDFTANQDITLELRPGQIHALLGENGAGKSFIKHRVPLCLGVL